MLEPIHRPTASRRRAGRALVAPAAARIVLLLAAVAVLGGCQAPGSTQPTATAQARSTVRAVPAGAQGTGPQLGVEAGAHAAFVRRLDVDPARGLVVTASDDKTARVWDLQSGNLRHVLRPAVGGGELGRLYGAAIHPTDDLVAIGGTTGVRAGEHRILLFSLQTGQLVRAFDARGGDVKKLAWSADGSLLIAVYAGDHALRAFDRDGAMIHQQALAGPAYGLAVARDGRVAASSLDGQITVLSAKQRTVAPVASFRAPYQEPVGVAFSPDGSRLAIGFRRTGQAPVIVDAVTGRTVITLAKQQLTEGTQFTVAWSADGRSVAVGGSGYTADRRYPVYLHDASSGRESARHDVAVDTIFDLVPLPDGRFAYASADGTWGLVGGPARPVAVTAAIPDLRGPTYLRVSGDGRRIGWMNAWGREPTRFEVDRRLVVAADAGPPADLMEPRSSVALRDAPVWQDTTRPRLNGRPFDLDAGEVSRAIAYLPDGRDAILGTSHRLMRVDPDGAIRWQLRNAGEVRAVNVTGDGRMVVAGLSDGTVRWWRSSDGVPLMSLLAMRDGRWVLWTPEGYFDAGAGADRLVGWSVNRADTPLADHFSLNRFRDGFARPDLVDAVLQTATPASEMRIAPLAPKTAVAPVTAPAPAASPALATLPSPTPAVVGVPAPVAVPSPVAVPAPVAITAPVPVAAAVAPVALQPAMPTRFPPVIGAVDLSAMRVTAGALTVPVAVRGSGPVEIEVRIDGRPVPEAVTRLAAGSGTRTAVATLPAPPPGSLVQFIAKDRNGVSEPVAFIVEALAANPAPPALRPTVPIAQPAAVRIEPSLATAATAPSAPPPPPSPPASIAPGATVPGGGRTGTGPRLHVLAIGVSEYQRAEYRLGLAAKDATDFGNAMRLQTGRQYRDVQVRSLTNQQATRMAVIANLKWLSDNVGSGDIGMLFIAGHGVNGPDGQYYFLPHDGNHEQLEKTGLPQSAIRDTLGRMRGKAVLFVDTCFGGNAAGNFRTASRELAPLANDLAAAENGVIVFASSSGRQLSEENDAWGNGAFTRALVAGLSGRADLMRTGRVTFKGLDFYVSEEVSKLTDGRQTPVTLSPDGVPDFAIARVGTT